MPRLFCVLLVLVLALPTFGQREALLGTWEHVDTTDPDMPLTGQFQLMDNDRFALHMGSTMSGQSLLAGEDSLGAGTPDPVTQLLAQAFPESLVFSVHITGVWAVDGSALRLDAQTSEVQLNGRPIQEGVTQLAQEMAQTLALLLQIPEAAYPVFEAQIIAQVNAGYSENLSEGFAADEADLDGTYSLADGVLYITDEDGETTDWHPSPVSAVEALSWGQLKAAGSPPSSPSTLR